VAGNCGDRAFRYTPGIGLVNLGVLPGAAASRAAGINNSGQVVGTSGSRAFRTTATGLVSDAGTDLGVISSVFPLSGSGAFAINASGQVTGWSTAFGSYVHAFRTTATGLISDPGTDLGTLPQASGNRSRG
jgi:probable HAF family extracellular repeat protein